jgi:hypothetical protein
VTAQDNTAAAADFFAAYFHEDWIRDARNPVEVAAQFVRDSSSADVLRVAQGIEEFVARRDSEEVLRLDLFRELGCYYLPSVEGKSVRQWLGEMARLLRESVHG